MIHSSLRATESNKRLVKHCCTRRSPLPITWIYGIALRKQADRDGTMSCLWRLGIGRRLEASAASVRPDPPQEMHEVHRG